MTRTSKKESLPSPSELKGDIDKVVKLTKKSEQYIRDLEIKVKAYTAELSQNPRKKVLGIDIGSFILKYTDFTAGEAVTFLNYLGYSAILRSAQMGARQKIDISNNPVGEELNPSNTGEGTNSGSNDEKPNNTKTTGQIVWIRSEKKSYNTGYSSE